MKVLWITNIVFPEAMQQLGGLGELRETGGWMLGAAEALVSNPMICLAVASPFKSADKLKQLKGKHIDYYLFPQKERKYGQYMEEIKEKFSPDIVHIHGTEYSHGLAYIKRCGPEGVVVSIQGLVSVYSHYYTYGMSKWDILLNMTIRDWIRGSLLTEKRRFRKRGEVEKELLGIVKHIIGRTNWDKAHAWAINPDAQYHFCNETLRSEFYTGEWRYDKCVPHTIFISQAQYPIKGLHQLLKALPLVLRHYPDVQVRIAGRNIVKADNLRQWLMRDGYGKYLSKLIRKYNLTEHVTFLGPLNVDGMKAEYMRANIFVCPSAIENSPNSVGESQLLGTPCLCCYVGGTPDMMKGDEAHLYRFEEIETLAKMICDIFNFNPISGNKQTMCLARDRHDRQRNADQLIGIYHKVLGKSVNDVG